MKRSNLLCAAVLGVIAVAVQAAEPEFNKECAMGLVMEEHVPTDCSVTWTSDTGKVYCFGNEAARDKFLEAPETNIAGAETFWSP